MRDVKSLVHRYLSAFEDAVMNVDEGRVETALESMRSIQIRVTGLVERRGRYGDDDIDLCALELDICEEIQNIEDYLRGIRGGGGDRGLVVVK